MNPYRVLNSEPSIPVLANIPHAVALIPPEYGDQFVLTAAELEAEQRAIVDWFTDELYQPIVSAGGCALIAGVSRLLVDTERFADDEQEVMARRGVGVIYERTTRQARLRRPLTGDERAVLLQRFYEPYHAEMAALVQGIVNRFGRCVILDCHSFPAKALPYELTPDADRPAICLGTDPNHTPESLVTRLETITAGFGWRCARNTPFAGTIVPLQLWGDERVSSVMLEVNRGLYMDEATTTRAAGFPEVVGWVDEVIQGVVEWDRGRSHDYNAR